MVFQRRRPSQAEHLAFVEAQRDQPFTYAEVGATQALEGPLPLGYFHNRFRLRLGSGRAAFDAARDVVAAWGQFPTSWTQFAPPDASAQTGQVVSLAAHAFGMWALTSCRVVYVVDEPRRYSVAYGTLPRHVEVGEEAFHVLWLDDDSVWYELAAFARPGHWLVKLTNPLCKRLQRRFARESAAAVEAAVQRHLQRAPQIA